MRDRGMLLLKAGLLAWAFFAVSCQGAANPPPELYVGIKYNPAMMAVGGSGFSRYDLLLLPQGRALSLIPAGGALSLSEDQIQQTPARHVGRWSRDGRQLAVIWPHRRGAHQRQVYEKTTHGYLLNGVELKPVTCAKGNQTLEGQYRARTVGSAGNRNMRTGEINFASESVLTFSRKGTVTNRARTGFSTDTSSDGRIIGTQGRDFQASYRWEGCRLTIQSRSGANTNHTAFFWPGDGEKTLVFDGRIYDRQRD